jgi:hypothetical protein
MAFSYYKSFTTDHTQCGSGGSFLFIIAIYVIDPDLRTVGNGGYVQNSNGYDIRPYSDSALTSAITDYTLVYYVPTTGELEMYVTVLVNDTTDVTSYLALGDGGISTDGSDPTMWQTGINYFDAVYHLKDGTTLSLVDATTNGYTLTNHNTATPVAAVLDGGVQVVAASSQYLSQSNSKGVFSGALSLGMSAWINRASTSDVMSFGFSTAVNFRVGITVFSDGNTYFVVENGGLNYWYVADSLTGWHFYTLVFSVSGGVGFVAGYIDGVSQSLTHGAGTNPTSLSFAPNLGDFLIGFEGASSTYSNGKFDDVRLSGIFTSLTDNYIIADYNNQKIGSTFLTWGSLTPVSGGGTGSPHMLLLGLG